MNGFAKVRTRSPFGKEPLFEIIRQHASLSAHEIVSAIVKAVNRYRKDAFPEDDAILVVIKVT